ncbi:hypothetical protein [Spirillospora sp. NPDC029432]|uniref:hypothetical protein n=1 Tax=Spirillospora sp. NPDC029432 TaxID=3154599 RepID=UPI003456D015
MADAAPAGAPPMDAPCAGLPVLPALRPLLPGGLRPGSAVGVAGPGSASLGLALVAGVSRRAGEAGGAGEADAAGAAGAGDGGGWCAIVGLPDLGLAAAAGMGAAPERLLLVDEPGERWPDVVAALAEAVDLVLLNVVERPAAPAVRRLSALARKHGCVLALTGAYAREWPGTRLRLRVADSEWRGLGDGHGVLRGRRARVVADAPGRERDGWLWLPGPDGAVTPAGPPAVGPAGRPDRPGRPRLDVVA